MSGKQGYLKCPQQFQREFPSGLRTKKIQKLDLFCFHPELSPRELKQNGVEFLLSSLDSVVPPKEIKEVWGELAPE